MQSVTRKVVLLALGEDDKRDFSSDCLQLAFVTTTSESFKQIKLWIDYHKSIGVNHFYLFVDGQVQQPPQICMPLCLQTAPGVLSRSQSVSEPRTRM